MAHQCVFRSIWRAINLHLLNVSVIYSVLIGFGLLNTENKVKCSKNLQILHILVVLEFNWELKYGNID